MKDLNLKNKWLQVIIGALLLAAGIVVIVINATNSSKITDAISWLVAIFLFLIGGLVLIFALLRTRIIFTPSFVYGSLLIALGVVFCVTGFEFIETGVPVFLGTLLISFGAVSLVKAILLINFKAKVGFIVLFFLLAATSIALGILCLIYKKDSLSIIYYSLGALLVAYGFAQLIYGAMNWNK